MNRTALDILWEDNHLLVVNKPAGLATQGALPGEASLVEVAKQYIKNRYQKPGNVYLGVVSRLDAAVTGAVVLARTSKAASRLSQLWAARETLKIYWALVAGTPRPAAGSCEDWLWHDDQAHRVRVVGQQQPGAKWARLTYQTLKSGDRGLAADRTLLEITLETGRKHQIRVQLAQRGWPVIGDRKYGSQQSWPTGIALHARRVAFVHPVRDTLVDLTAPLPSTWGRLGEGPEMVS